MHGKKILLYCIACWFCIALYAESPKSEDWQAAKKGEVAFICRVVFAEPLDTEFYATGFDSQRKKDVPIKYNFIIYPGTDPTKSKAVETLFSVYDKTFTFGDFSELILDKSLFKKGYTLHSFSVLLFENEKARLSLPARFKIRFPDEAQYVYLGTFVYTLEGFYLRPAKPVLLDEFETANKALNEKLGKNVQLYRAALTSAEE